jgi:hypothetical protein
MNQPLALPGVGLRAPISSALLRGIRVQKVYPAEAGRDRRIGAMFFSTDESICLSAGLRTLITVPLRGVDGDRTVYNRQIGIQPLLK